MIRKMPLVAGLFTLNTIILTKNELLLAEVLVNHNAGFS